MGEGIHIQEVEHGDGAVAERGRRVSVRYDAFLIRGDAFQRGIVATFKLGRREVIAGLESGVEGLRAGGRRRIRVSPHLSCGDRVVPRAVPANTVLTFDVELISVEED